LVVKSTCRFHAIIEAARLLGCRRVLSEDLNHGQEFDGITVVNPFRADPATAP